MEPGPPRTEYNTVHNTAGLGLSYFYIQWVQALGELRMRGILVCDYLAESDTG